MFELLFGRKPGINLYNLKNLALVDSIELEVYITRKSAGGHRPSSNVKEDDNRPKVPGGMTFTQNKKPVRKNTNYPLTFFEKAHKNARSVVNLKGPQIAISGTKHTVTTDKNNVIPRKLCSNHYPF